MQEGKKWYQSKTMLTGLGAILGSVGAAMHGDINTATAVQSGIAALMMMFMRQGAGTPIQ